MRELLSALVSRDGPVDIGIWRTFWDQLAAGRLRRGEAAAVLASLSTLMPADQTVAAMVDSLDERRAAPSERFPGTVNIVGTGGGPKTFNVSTASALVAAALGVPVIKTGSHAYSSRYGSFDLLAKLGISLTRSYEQTAETLDRFGIACAGYFVYPDEIAMLARTIVPLDLRTVGRFLNSVGPFLASMPVSAQVTGVSDAALLPGLRFIASRQLDKRVWLCTNVIGADELISFTDNLIYPNDGSGEFTVAPDSLAPATGTITDLRPSGEVVEHFLGVISGRAPVAAVHTVCLNAAALAIASGLFYDWSAAFNAAKIAIQTGAVTDLVRRMRAHANTAAGVGVHG